MAYTTINKPNQYFDTQLWTGTNASGRTFTGLNFQPNFIWSKCRNSANYNHVIVDRVRGGNYFIFPNSTVAEDNKSHGEITSWNSDGSTWIDGTNVTYPRAYYNDGAGSALGGSTYVSWNWKAGDSAGLSNTAGSITSTVSANTTSGFSIVSWAGNQTAGASCGHGLGVAPSMIFKRRRNGDGADFWYVYHKSLGNSNSVYLNDTSGSAASGAWNSQTPTSTVFYHGSSIRENGGNMIAYCFAPIKGYSAFASYTGNGSTDGTFIYTGFKPAFVLIKCSSAAENWHIFDDVRNTYNTADKDLRPNTTGAETTSSLSNIDFLSNGFKLRNGDADYNGSGTTYIGFAVAEQPFVSSKSIPTTAR